MPENGEIALKAVDGWCDVRKLDDFTAGQFDVAV